MDVNLKLWKEEINSIPFEIKIDSETLSNLNYSLIKKGTIFSISLFDSLSYIIPRYVLKPKFKHFLFRFGFQEEKKNVCGFAHINK